MTEIIETLHNGASVHYEASEILFETVTAHQKLVIFRNDIFGIMISLDGVTQVTQRDEFVYHEMMAHTPLFAHGKAKDVLIIGGGDGGVLREVLKHQEVETVTLVEVDAEVIELCEKYMPFIADESFEDERVEVIIDDGAKFVANTGNKYDIIIVDSTDPIGPGETLFSKDFYFNVSKTLNEGGIVVTQNGVPFVQGLELRDTMDHFRGVFKHATGFQATIPTYVFGAMVMGWGTNSTASLDVTLEVLKYRIRYFPYLLYYYSPEVHKAAFALPPYIKRLMVTQNEDRRNLDANYGSSLGGPDDHLGR